MGAALLVPVDPARPSPASVRVAGLLARRLELGVRLVSVRQDGSYRDAAHRLGDVADELRGLGIEHVGSRLVDQRRPADVIVELAEPDTVALVCMASRSRHGSLRRIVGSTTERVLAASRVPVLVTGPRCVAPTQPIDRVVACWDGSAPAARAVTIADDLRSRLGADLTLLEVVVDPARVLPDSIHRGADLRDVAASLHRPRAETTVIEGFSVVRSIVEHLDDGRGRVVVVGTHGRSGLSTLMLGSVAEAVLAQAPCPVVVVPPAASVPGLLSRPCERATAGCG